METRLKQLPTIDDFINKTTKSDVITSEERTKVHNKIYASKPLLEIINLEKEFVSKSGMVFKTKNI